MKENKNTPNWLKKAQKSIEEFENSKYAKMSDGKIKAAIGGSLSPKRYDPEYQSQMGKLGGYKGHIVGDKTKRKIYGDNYNAYMKSTLYDNIKDKKEFHKKGAKTSGDVRRFKKESKWKAFLNELPNAFNKSEALPYIEKHNLPGNVLGRMCNDTDWLISKGRGKSITYYKTETNLHD